MIRLLIADDHTMFREGLRTLLESDESFDVVAEAGNAREAVSKVCELRPDVVLLDVRMPGRGAVETVSDLAARQIDSRVLILTAAPEDRYAVQVLKAGAHGFITKECHAEELKSAIRQIARGGKYIGPKLAEAIAFSVTEPDRQPHDTLSTREREVMLRIATGNTVGEIAEELALSPKTVSTYRSRVLEKLQLRNNSEIVRYALRHQLVD